MRDFLKTVVLFNQMNIDAVLPYCEQRTYDKNDIIIQEGMEGENLYILQSGRAEVLKGPLHSQEVEHLGEISPGEWVGEMAVLENDMTTATVRAVERSDVIVFHLKKFLSQHHRTPVTAMLAKTLSMRLRRSNEERIVRLKEKLNMTRVLVDLFILIAFYLVLFKYIAKYNASSIITDISSVVLIGSIGISVIYIIYHAKLPLRVYGLTSKNWMRNTLDGILFSIPALILIGFLKWIMIHTFSWAKQIPLIEIPKTDLLFMGLYILLVPVQEIVVRGILQTSFRSFFHGPNRVLYAILTSNLLFEMFHNIKALSLSLGVFGLGIFWGFLFEQQKSLVGPIVSHIVIGGISFSFLNIDRVFIF